MKLHAILLLCATCAFAEVHTMTLDQALQRALDQNPDVLLARLDQEKSKNQVSITSDAFALKLGVGSGLAYNNGMPTSMDGQAPSLFTTRGSMALFDKPQSYKVARAQEAIEGATLGITMRKEEAAYRVTMAFLNAESALRRATAARQQAASLQEVLRIVETRVTNGQELDIERKRANHNLNVAKDAVDAFEASEATIELDLSQILGFPAGDQVRPAMELRDAQAMPLEAESVSKAIGQSTEIQRLQSQMRELRLQIKSYQAERLPKINFFSQYYVLSTFNNYKQYYGAFKVNNVQIGASFEIPILTGRAPKAGIALAQRDIDKLGIQIQQTQSRITADIRQSYADLKRAESARDLRKEGLDIAREDTNLLLTQYGEGRATMAQVEAARAAEQAEFINYYEALRVVELAQLNVRKNTGTILASVR